MDLVISALDFPIYFIFTSNNSLMVENLAPNSTVHVVFHTKFINRVGLEIVHNCFSSWAELKNPFLFFIFFSVSNCIKSVIGTVTWQRPVVVRIDEETPGQED